MLEKLRQLAARFDEVSVLLESPEVCVDQARSRPLMKERGRLQKTVETFREYEEVLKQKEDAQNLVSAGGDPELV